MSIQEVPAKPYHQHIPHDSDSGEPICTEEETLGFFEKQITSIHNLMRAKNQLPSFDSVRRAAEEVDGRFAAKNFSPEIPPFLQGRLPAYGERRILAVETVLCELNYLTREELRQGFEQARAEATNVPDANDQAAEITPHPINERGENTYTPRLDQHSHCPQYQPGDLVQVLTHAQPGHIRTPVYLLGKKGRITHLQGCFLNPEDLAHFKPTVLQLPLYLVEFDMLEVWGDRCPKRSQNDKIRVEIYEPWLTALT
ncbi:MAG: SH3-like domain-containing protein [Leptolyngbyaceae bacterium]|nr:SH3-like domain-containing protein [Leptolyngbyaceae bacterium]